MSEQELEAPPAHPLPLPPVAPPPDGDLSDVPDSATKRALDFTGSDAENRILFVNCGFFRYGTDDKTHAAAILLSIVLLLVAILIILIGLFSSNLGWLERALSWVGTTFVFTAGVAIGRGGTKRAPDE